MRQLQHLCPLTDPHDACSFAHRLQTYPSFRCLAKISPSSLVSFTSRAPNCDLVASLAVSTSDDVTKRNSCVYPLLSRSPLSLSHSISPSNRQRYVTTNKSSKAPPAAETSSAAASVSRRPWYTSPSHRRQVDQRPIVPVSNGVFSAESLLCAKPARTHTHTREECLRDRVLAGARACASELGDGMQW